MKYIAAIICLIALYFYLAFQKPRKPAPEPLPPIASQPAKPTTAPAPASTKQERTYYHRPLDRTHEVLDQVKGMRKDDGF